VISPVVDMTFLVSGDPFLRLFVWFGDDLRTKFVLCMN
jgi:hypothetical protein